MFSRLLCLAAISLFLAACGSSHTAKKQPSADELTLLNSLPTLQVVNVQHQANTQTATMIDEFDNHFIVSLNKADKTVYTTLKKGQQIKLIGDYAEQDNNGQTIIRIEAEKIIRIK